MKVTLNITKSFLLWHKLSQLANMKTAHNLPKKKWLFVTIDPALNEYKDKIMFLEKLEQANNILKTAKLPLNKNRR